MVSLVYHFVSGEKKFYQRQRQNVVGARDKKKRQRLYHIGSQDGAKIINGSPSFSGVLSFLTAISSAGAVLGITFCIRE